MLHVRQLRDGRYRLTLWHHIQPCPDDEERYDLILERSIPVIVLRETFQNKSKPDLIKACVEMTVIAYGLVAQKQADLPLGGHMSRRNRKSTAWKSRRLFGCGFAAGRSKCGA